MKNLSKIIGIFALAAVITFLITACDEVPFKDRGKTPEDLPAVERWSKFVAPSSTATLDLSVDTDGVCTITVGGTAMPNVPGGLQRYQVSAKYSYTAKANTSYTYVFEAWTAEGERTINVQYSIDSFEKEPMFVENPINSTRKTYTVRGGIIPESGERKLEFQCADQLGTFYVKVLSITEYVLEDLPVKDRWTARRDPSSTATLENFSVSNYGLATITIGGVPEPQGENDIWRAWTITAQYRYNAKANTNYIYEIEAWTKSGERSLNVQYYEDNDAEIYLGESIWLTEERTTYTIKSRNLPSGQSLLLFQCADNTGTFYVRILDIYEYESKRGDLYITNYDFSSLGYYFGEGVAYFDNNPNERLLFTYSSIISVTALNYGVCKEIYVDDEWKTIPFTGNITVPAGNFWFSSYTYSDSQYHPHFAINKVPIIFTNGSATIDFSADMELIENTLTIATSNHDFTENNWVYVDAYFENSDLSLYFSSQEIQITDNSITLELTWIEPILYARNGTVAAGDLRIVVDRVDGYCEYTNKVPITFTNGNATIDFSADMELVVDDGKG